MQISLQQHFEKWFVHNGVDTEICGFHPQHVTLMTCVPTNFNLMEYLKGPRDLISAGALLSTDTHITWSVPNLFDARSLNLESKQDLCMMSFVLKYIYNGLYANSITLNPSLNSLLCYWWQCYSFAVNVKCCFGTCPSGNLNSASHHRLIPGICYFEAELL